MHSVVLTSIFEKQAKEEGLNDDKVMEIASSVAADPTGGDLIVGTGGARKVRHAGRGKGKGGVTQAERNDLAKILPKIADAYRRRKK